MAVKEADSYATLPLAFAACAAGDVLQLRNGSAYNLNDGTPGPFVINKPITIQGEGRYNTGIYAAPTFNGFEITSSDVMIRDLTINGINPIYGYTGHGLTITAPATVFLNGIVLQRVRCAYHGLDGFHFGEGDAWGSSQAVSVTMDDCEAVQNEGHGLWANAVGELFRINGFYSRLNGKAGVDIWDCGMVRLRDSAAEGNWRYSASESDPFHRAEIRVHDDQGFIIDSCDVEAPGGSSCIFIEDCYGGQVHGGGMSFPSGAGTGKVGIWVERSKDIEIGPIGIVGMDGAMNFVDCEDCKVGGKITAVYGSPPAMYGLARPFRLGA
jgi:hypothetical protein